MANSRPAANPLIPAESCGIRGRSHPPRFPIRSPHIQPAEDIVRVAVDQRLLGTVTEQVAGVGQRRVPDQITMTSL